MSDKLYRLYVYTDDLVKLLRGETDGWVFPPDTEFHAWQHDTEGNPVLLLASDEPFTAHGQVLRFDAFDWLINVMQEAKALKAIKEGISNASD